MMLIVIAKIATRRPGPGQVAAAAARGSIVLAVAGAVFHLILGPFGVVQWLVWTAAPLLLAVWWLIRPWGSGALNGVRVRMAAIVVAVTTVTSLSLYSLYLGPDRGVHQSLHYAVRAAEAGVVAAVPVGLAERHELSDSVLVFSCPRSRAFRAEYIAVLHVDDWESAIEDLVTRYDMEALVAEGGAAVRYAAEVDFIGGQMKVGHVDAGIAISAETGCYPPRRWGVDKPSDLLGM